MPAFELDDSEPVSTHGRGVCRDCERNCSHCFDIEKWLGNTFSVGQIDSLRDRGCLLRVVSAFGRFADLKHIFA